MNDHAKLLKTHPLFAHLSSRTLDRITANAAVVNFPKGGLVVKERDPGDALYVLLSGRCRSSMILPDGSDHILDIYTPGDTFGERPLLSRDRFWMNVKVLTDSVLLRIDGSDVREQLARNSKLEKLLEHRMHGQLRMLRQDRAPEKLGRVTVFSSLSEAARGNVILHNTALAVRQETGGSVLTVQVVHGEGAPSLVEMGRLYSRSLADLRTTAEVRKSGSGLWQLRLYVRGTPEERQYVAPLLSHLGAQARYLILHLGPNVPSDILLDVLVQADVSYLLLTQRPADLFKGNLLARQLHAHPMKDSMQVLPMVCLDHEEPAQDYETLDKQLGLPVHGFIHALPPGTADAHDHYRHSRHGRFSAHIRHLAREIGRCRVGLALSAGGAKSLAHIGVIQVLEAHGIAVDVIAGTSMGALVGALWAYGIDGNQMEAIARRHERRGGLWKLFDPVIPPRKGFIRGRAIARTVRDAIGNAHFSDLQQQLRVVATDLNTLERVVYDSGEVAPAVHASMAMPGIVVPVKVNGRTLVDGGVADPLPISVLMEMGVEHIIAVNTIPNPDEMKFCIMINEELASHTPKERTLWGRINRHINYFARGNVLDIWMKSMHGAETRVAESACKHADVVLRPVSCDGRWHDFKSPGKYIALGRMVAQENLEALKALVRDKSGKAPI